MKNKSVILGVFIGIILATTAIVGCQKTTGQQATDATSSTKAAANNPHKSGAIDLSQFPELKNEEIIEQAKKNLLAVKSLKVIEHITAKKDDTVTADSDFEVTYIAPNNVYFFGDDNFVEKRQEIFQLGDTEYKSFDGKNWTKSNKVFPKYDFIPEGIAKALDEGENFRLVAEDRLEGTYKSCTVVIFERPSMVYIGQKEQIAGWIDNATKNVVRFELLSNEKKPVTFTEKFYRYSSFDDPSLKIELPTEAK